MRKKNKPKVILCSIHSKWSKHNEKCKYKADFPFYITNFELFGHFSKTPLYQRYPLVRTYMNQYNYINARDIVWSFILHGYNIPKEVQDLIVWINLNICCKLDLLNKKSLGVLTRIVAGKLNNLEKNGIINSKYNFHFHSHFLRNIGYYRYKYEEEAILGDIPF